MAYKSYILGISDLPDTYVRSLRAALRAYISGNSTFPFSYKQLKPEIYDLQSLIRKLTMIYCGM